MPHTPFLSRDENRGLDSRCTTGWLVSGRSTRRDDLRSGLIGPRSSQSEPRTLALLRESWRFDEVSCPCGGR